MSVVSAELGVGTLQGWISRGLWLPSGELEFGIQNGNLVAARAVLDT